MSEVSLSRVLTWYFLEMAPNPRKPHLYSCRRALLISEPNFTFPPRTTPLFSLDFAPIRSVGETAMASKRKKQSSVVAIILPIDPNSQLPFAGNHMSVISEFDLLHLVDVEVLPPKELCSWRICREVTVPMEDTHESIVYVPFLICGLALPISPFFHGLLDFLQSKPDPLEP
jgi:hypothetical protein